MNDLDNEDIPTYYYITKGWPKMINGIIEINKNLRYLQEKVSSTKKRKKNEPETKKKKSEKEFFVIWNNLILTTLSCIY